MFVLNKLLAQWLTKALALICFPEDQIVDTKNPVIKGKKKLFDVKVSQAVLDKKGNPNAAKCPTRRGQRAVIKSPHYSKSVNLF